MKQLNWNPETQTIHELIEELNRIEGELVRWEFWKTWFDENMPSLPTMPIPEDILNEYPIWTMDFEGNCLVGDAAEDIEHINRIREYLADME